VLSSSIALVNGAGRAGFIRPDAYLLPTYFRVTVRYPEIVRRYLDSRIFSLIR
jgi:hypothetical protein